MKSKREYGSGHLLERNGKWYLRVRLQDGSRKTIAIRDPETGLTITGKMQARNLAHELTNQIRSGIYQSPQEKRISKDSEQTVGSAIDHYIQTYQQKYSPEWVKTIETYLRKRFAQFTGESTPIADVNDELFDDFLHSKEIKGGRSSLSNKTMNVIAMTVRKFLKYCKRKKWLKELPEFERYRVQEKEYGRVLSDNEINSILIAAQSISIDAHHFVLLGLYAGLRHAEALAVTWDCINMKENEIKLAKQKNLTAKPAPLLKPLRDVLVKTPKRDRRGVLVSNRSANGERIPLKNYRGTWNRIKKTAKVDPKIRFHDLRHTFTTFLYKQFGFEARELTRHKSTSAFAGYIHSKRKHMILKVNEEF